MKLIFVITVIKSRGEAFLSVNAARSLRACGHDVMFVAMADVAVFLEQQGCSVCHLTPRREQNRAIIRSLIADVRPNGIVYVSYRNLFLGIGIGKVFDPVWFSDAHIPQASFDPENYPRGQRSIDAGPLIGRTYPLPVFPKDMNIISTDFIEQVKAPPRTFFYRPEYQVLDKKKCREELGWAADMPVIVFPLSRWIYDNTVYFGSSYYTDMLPNLIQHYCAQLRTQVTVCCIGHKNIFSEEKWGDVRVIHLPQTDPLSYERTIAAADLLLTDNGMSGSIEIATAQTTPVLVMKNSVTAGIVRNTLRTDASFTLSPFVREVMSGMLEEHPRSIFPFAVYPLGWWDIIEHLFADNPLYRTFSEVELFDEGRATTLLRDLLFDASLRKKVTDLQRRYTERQSGLHTFPELMSILFKAQS